MKTISFNVPTASDARHATRNARKNLAGKLAKLASKIEPTKQQATRKKKPS